MYKFAKTYVNENSKHIQDDIITKTSTRVKQPKVFDHHQTINHATYTNAM